MKITKKLLALVLVLTMTMTLGLGVTANAASDDKPILALGADLSTDQRAAVCHRPCNIDWCLISRNQTLIGIDKRIGNRRHSFHMFHQTADKPVCFFAES